MKTTGTQKTECPFLGSDPKQLSACVFLSKVQMQKPLKSTTADAIPLKISFLSP